MDFPLQRSRRVALYSHDTMGLGHARRNLLIAQALATAATPPTILLIAGVREVTAFPLPPGTDQLTLPALGKSADGRYHARSLGLSLSEIVRLRQRTISAALEAFEPDVFIVDNVPRGAVRELDPILPQLQHSGRTRCVLGLRDVLDDPAVVRREWAQAENEEAIRRYYDAVWVYGDPAVYDLARACQLAPDVAGKIQYTGYLDQRARTGLASTDARPRRPRVDLPPGRLVLCLVGGGQDGARLAEAFARARFPADTTGVIVTGPYMPAEARRMLDDDAVENPRLRILDFVAEPEALLAAADRIVAMGGYNTVGEVLAHEKRSLLVPRVSPRREQWVRAARLRDLGLVDVLHPDDLSPAAVSAWLERELAEDRPAPRVRERIDLNGLARLPVLLAELLRSPGPLQARVGKGYVSYAAR
jgi:predicted glycosyltransferase